EKAAGNPANGIGYFRDADELATQALGDEHQAHVFGESDQGVVLRVEPFGSLSQQAVYLGGKGVLRQEIGDVEAHLDGDELNDQTPLFVVVIFLQSGQASCATDSIPDAGRLAQARRKGGCGCEETVSEGRSV